MTIKMLREKLAPAKYQFSIATNMESELGMVNPDDPFLTWRVDWYLAWKNGRYTPKAKLRVFLLEPTKKDFVSIYKQLNEDEALVKFAECSNFACHAMAILLKSSEVTTKYNVCLASAGKYLNHTIAILLPKDIEALTKGWQMDDLSSKGALIVDPWAMTMGYGAEVALAVKPDEYVYAELLDNVSFIYQSIHDSTVSQISPNRSIGKIAAEKMLALELRLFGRSDLNKSSTASSIEQHQLAI